ncbi:MAG: N-acetyltransferase, partial [Arenibacterium sp.]
MTEAPVMSPPYFGNDAQQRLLRRGRDLHELIADDPRFTYYGRTVGLNAPDDGSLDQLLALVRLQGNSNYAEVPNADMTALSAEVATQGYKPVTYARWEGGSSALEAANRINATMSVPKGLTVHRLSANTPPALLEAFADTALTCGVLPPATAVLAGLGKPGITLLAVTKEGKVASCAAASAHLSLAHKDARESCWWGMLSTHPDYRGAGLALLLGATVILRMHEDLGYQRFFTGVEPGNTASETV